MALKLIVDTDPGIDDAMAIFYAIAAPEIDLLGLTTVFGNVTTPKATRNALYLLEQAGIEIPVAEGMHRPRMLPPFPPSSAVHGGEGLGTLDVPTSQRHALVESAPEYLVRMARAHKGGIIAVSHWAFNQCCRGDGSRSVVLRQSQGHGCHGRQSACRGQYHLGCGGQFLS